MTTPPTVTTTPLVEGIIATRAVFDDLDALKRVYFSTEMAAKDYYLLRDQIFAHHKKKQNS